MAQIELTNAHWERPNELTELTARVTHSDGRKTLTWYKFRPKSKGKLPSIERTVKINDDNTISELIIGR